LGGFLLVKLCGRPKRSGQGGDSVQLGVIRKAGFIQGQGVLLFEE